MPCPYNIVFGVGKRHCRVLIHITQNQETALPCPHLHYPKSGDGNAVSLQYYYGTAVSELDRQKTVSYKHQT